MKRKQSTGLVGIAVNYEPRKTLLGLYTKTLEALQAIPPQAEYRRAVEKVTNYRMNVVNSAKSVEEIET